MSFDVISLLSVSFLAATILPAQSEILLGYLYLTGNNNPYILLLYATIGNVLGSCINWVIGRYLRTLEHKKWFRSQENKLAKASYLYNKYGIWTLIFAWLPFIGDPLTIVAGLLRTNIYIFVALVTLGKITRYFLVLYALGFRI